MVTGAIRCDDRHRSRLTSSGQAVWGLDMDDGESRLREALRAGERLTPFVGAGLSSAMTDEAPCATWRGLLSEGIDTCKRWVREEPEEWAEDSEEAAKKARQAQLAKCR